MLLIGLPCLTAVRQTSFSVQHPAIFSESNSYSSNNHNNEILNQEASVDNVISTYNSNNLFSSDDHVSVPINDGFSEGRILNGKSFLFGNNFLHNGLFRDVSKLKIFKISL